MSEIVLYEKCIVCSEAPFPNRKRCLKHLIYQLHKSKESRLADSRFNDKRREQYSSDENHRELIKARVRLVAIRDPNYNWRQSLKKYGMTVGDWENLNLFQGQRCALCFTDNPGGRGNLHVDHDHVTGQIRGLLCHWCNTALPRVDIEGWAKRASEYIGVVF